MISRLKQPLVLAFIACSLGCYANQTPAVIDPEVAVEHRAVVGVRPLSKEQKEELDKQKADVILEMRKQMQEELSGQASFVPLTYRPVSGFTIKPVFYSPSLHSHYLTGLSYDGRFIEIEDKSRFEVAPDYIYISRNWRSDHIYSITPNYNWLSYTSRYCQKLCFSH